MFVRTQTSMGATEKGPASAIRDECISYLGLFRNRNTPQQYAAWEIVRHFGSFQLHGLRPEGGPCEPPPAKGVAVNCWGPSRLLPPAPSWRPFRLSGHRG